MAKQIAKLLKATIEDTSDLKKIAKTLAGKGRGGDSMLAHITPKEAEMLKSAGGSGTINPDTGLLEFYDWSGAPDISDSYTEAPAFNVRPQKVETFGTPEFDYGNASYKYTPAAPTVETPSFAFQPQRSSFGTPEYYAGYTPPPTPLPTGVYKDGRLTSSYVGQQAPSPYALDTQRADFAPPLPEEVAPAEKGYLEKLKERLTKPETLERLGLAGIGALPGIYFANKAAKEGRRAKEEMQRLAAPYQTEGKRLLEQAQRGELTAPAQQQVQALQARAAQGVAARGGVGAEQAAAQVEAFRQQLLSNQYDLGLKVSGIGDQIATGAIRTGLQADQYVNQLTASYYGNLFRDIGGLNQPVIQQTQQPR